MEVDQAEADFKALQLVWDALKLNSTTLQSQLDGYDRKATALIAAAGVLLGLSVTMVLQRSPHSMLVWVLLAAAAAVAIASQVVGALGVIAPGLVEVPYVSEDQLQDPPGPRDKLARDLAVTMSGAIARSRPTYVRKRRLFTAQIWLFAAASFAYAVVLISLEIGTIPKASCTATATATSATPVTAKCEVPK